MNVTGRYGFDAPPEVVFGTLTDPDRVDRWMPAGVTAERAGSDRIRLSVRGTEVECQFSAVPADMRLEWRLVDRPELHGSVRAEDGPGGGAEVHVAVHAPGGEPGAHRVQELVGDAMRRLQRDVSDNFNAG